MGRRVGISAAIDVVERGYDLDGTEAEWIAHIVRTIRPDIDDGMGAYGFTCSITGDALTPGPAFAMEGMSAHLADVLATMNAGAPASLTRSLAKSAVLCGTLETTLGPGHTGAQYFKRFMAPHGVADGFSIFAQDGEGSAIDLSSLRPRPMVPSERAARVWLRVGYHLASALRLRRRLAAKARREALLAPNGAIVDALPHVQSDAGARETLRAAARSIDRARSRAGRAEPDRALASWTSLVDGTWSLVDHWESDGRRWIAVYENRPRVPDPRALNPVDRAIAQLVALAASNKEIAFALGLTEGSVAGSVHRILRRFKCRRRVDFIAMAAAKNVGSISIDGDEVELLASSARVRDAVTRNLTKAEHEVAELLVRGASNAAIARKRNVSIHTIAKQVRAVLSKLGAANRSDLAKRLLDG